MKKENLILSFFIVSLVLLACNKMKPKADVITEIYPEEQAKVKSTLTHIFDLAQAKQMDSVESYHLYGPKFTKFDDGEPNRMDAESSKKGERNLFMSVTESHYNLENLKVDVFEDAAIATFIINVSFKMDTISGTAKSRGTLVFIKAGEDWKITHEHWSPFVLPPTHN